MNAESMGIVHVEVAVMSLDRRLQERLRLIVDTGSVLSWIPRAVLHRLGIVPSRTRRFRAIDGWTPPKEVGEAPIELEGLTGTVPVVFAEDSDMSVLGVSALEILGLRVDPSAARLEREEGSLALAVA